MPKKPEISINVTHFTEREVIKAISSECPDFELIPRNDQWVMALHAVGTTNATIASLTSRTEEGISKAVDRYAPMTSQLNDGAKARLNQRMMWNAVGSYISVMSDRKRIDQLKPVDAIKVLKEMPNLLRELMKIELEWYEHREEMNRLNYDGFANSLEAVSDGE
jgi:hypothetical protein